MWTFSLPRWKHNFKPASELQQVLGELSERAAELTASPRLTDTGRIADFTDTAKPALEKLAEFEGKARKALVRVAKARQTLRNAAEPPAPSLADRLEALELSKIARQDPKVREQILKRMVSGGDLSDAETRLLQAMGAQHPALWGITEITQGIIRDRLTPKLGKDGEKLDLEELEAQLTLDALRDAKVAILKAADRKALAEEGVIPKPVAEWTLAERVAWIGEHGADEYRSLLALETRVAGVPPVPGVSAEELLRADAESVDA